MTFQDRQDAGRKLAQALQEYASKDVIVLGLARGGLPVAQEVSQKLDAPLDLLVVRKLGFPFHPEFGFGAIAPGITIVNEQIVNTYGLDAEEVEAVRAKEEQELLRRLKEYRGGKRNYDLKDKTVLIIDDGIATGISLLAAVGFVKTFHPKRIVVAAPVAAETSLPAICAEADAVVCLIIPKDFLAVGQFYENFPQVSDEEVREILRA